MTLAKIVYASQTGNTEGISELLESGFKDKGIDVERLESDDAEDDVFDDADIAVVATFTYGNGEIPFDFEDFYDDLPDADLNGKVFGVVGSGSQEFHAETFGKAADLFEAAFEETGAKKGADTVKIDGAADEDADKAAITKFIDAMIAAAK